MAAGGMADRARAEEEEARPVKRRSVIILGAGMSGLVSGLLLHRAGHDVTILEYQDGWEGVSGQNP